MHHHRAAKAYSQVGLETGVAAASPHRLIVMLYDGASPAASPRRVWRYPRRSASSTRV